VSTTLREFLYSAGLPPHERVATAKHTDSKTANICPVFYSDISNSNRF